MNFYQNSLSLPFFSFQRDKPRGGIQPSWFSLMKGRRLLRQCRGRGEASSFLRRPLILHTRQNGRNPSLRSGSWRGWTASRGLRLPRDKTRLKSTIPRATPLATHTVTRITNSDLLVVDPLTPLTSNTLHVFQHWRIICRRINAGVEIGSRNAPSVSNTIVFP